MPRFVSAVGLCVLVVVADSAAADDVPGLSPLPAGALPPNTLPPVVLPFDPTDTRSLGIFVAGNGNPIKVTYDVSSLLGLRENPLVHRLLLAGIEITLDRGKLAGVGLTAGDAASAIKVFFKNHHTFKLSELQSLQLPDANDGKVHRLKEFATIDVTFKDK